MNSLTASEEQALEQNQQLLELCKTQGWQQVLKPLLLAKSHNSWLDPRGFKTKEELDYAYSKAWGLAQAAKEILEMVEQGEKVVTALLKKQKGEIDKFRIGA